MDFSKLDLIHYALVAIVLILLIRGIGRKQSSTIPAVKEGIKSGFSVLWMITTMGFFLVTMVALWTSPFMIAKFVLEMDIINATGMTQMYNAGTILLMYVPVGIITVMFLTIQDSLKQADANI